MFHGKGPRDDSTGLVFPIALLSLVLVAAGCAGPSLMTGAQATSIRERDHALARHADAIHSAIQQSGDEAGMKEAGDRIRASWLNQQAAQQRERLERERAAAQRARSLRNPL